MCLICLQIELIRCRLHRPKLEVNSCVWVLLAQTNNRDSRQLMVWWILNIISTGKTSIFHTKCINVIHIYTHAFCAPKTFFSFVFTKNLIKSTTIRFLLSLGYYSLILYRTFLKEEQASPGINVHLCQWNFQAPEFGIKKSTTWYGFNKQFAELSPFPP